MHPLQALLATVLPWINAGEAPDYAAEDGPPDQAQPGEGRRAAPAQGGAAAAAAAGGVRAGQGGEPELARAAGNGLMDDWGAYGFESDTDEEGEADQHPAGGRH